MPRRELAVVWPSSWLPSRERPRGDLVLFWLKKNGAASLAAAAFVTTVAVWASGALGVDWTIGLERSAWAAPACLATLLLSDGALDWLLGGIAGRRRQPDRLKPGLQLQPDRLKPELQQAPDSLAISGYKRRFARFAEYFAEQSWPAILAGGVLAAAEELLFRGVILEYLDGRVGMGPAAAVVMTATLFGAAHWIPQRELWPFALWAAWQGVVLGVLYLATQSLAALMIAHGLHDIAGFAMLRQRRRLAAGG